MANARRDTVARTMEVIDRNARLLEEMRAARARIISKREQLLQDLEALEDPTPEQQGRMVEHRRALGQMLRRENRKLARKAKRDRRRDRGDNYQSTDSGEEFNFQTKPTDESSSEATSESDVEAHQPSLASGANNNGGTVREASEASGN